VSGQFSMIVIVARRGAGVQRQWVSTRCLRKASEASLMASKAHRCLRAVRGDTTQIQHSDTDVLANSLGPPLVQEPALLARCRDGQEGVALFGITGVARLGHTWSMSPALELRTHNPCRLRRPAEWSVVINTMVSP
jgi:hypothetical protein